MHYYLSLSSCIVKCHFSFATMKSSNEYSSLYSYVSSHNWDTERDTQGVAASWRLERLLTTAGSWKCRWDHGFVVHGIMRCDCCSLAGCNLSLPRPLPSLKPTTLMNTALTASRQSRMIITGFCSSWAQLPPTDSGRSDRWHILSRKAHLGCFIGHAFYGLSDLGALPLLVYHQLIRATLVSIAAVECLCLCTSLIWNQS